MESTLYRKISSLMAAGMLASAAGAAHAVLYSIDDGTAERTLGASAGADALWLNSFSAQAGGELITTLQVQWGPHFVGCSFCSGAGRPVSALLYEDPNDDGNPTDAVLLGAVATTATAYGTGTYVDIPIAPTLVSGIFFVAALHEDPPDGSTFMTPWDTTTPAGKSWFLSQGEIDPADLSSAVQLPILVTGGLTDGNWMLRAVGVPIPEPSSLVLLGLGLAGLGRLRSMRLGA